MKRSMPNKKYDRKKFSKTARKTNHRNINTTLMRGGYRL